jgi:hypothetical protein
MKKIYLFTFLCINLIGVSQTFQSKIPINNSSVISNNGSIVISVYSPSNITNNGTNSCDLWFKTDEGNGVDYVLNGSSVSQWNNRGTLSINGTQGTGASQPTLANPLNGIYGMSFAYQYFDLTNSYQIPVNGSIFMIGEETTTYYNFYLIALGNSASTTYYGAITYDNQGSGNAESMNVRWNGTQKSTYGYITMTPTAYNFEGYVNMVTTSKFYSSSSSATIGSPYTTVNSVNCINKNSTFSSGSRGYLLEFWTHNKALNLTEVNYLRQYVCSKYALWTCEWFDKNNKSKNPFPVFYAYNEKFKDDSRIDLYYRGDDGYLKPIHLHVNCERLEELYGEINTQSWINITNKPKTYVQKYVNEVNIPYRDITYNE